MSLILRSKKVFLEGGFMKKDILEQAVKSIHSLIRIINLFILLMMPYKSNLATMENSKLAIR